MYISFIIPAHNEQSLIAQAIDAIRSAAREVAEQIENHEIIVVDDASTDRTADIARERGTRVIDVNKRQIAAVRNAGAREASGDVLIFVDADTILPADVLRGALRELRRGAVGGGSNMRMDGQIPLFGRLYMKTFMLVWRPLGYAAGCFLFCRRADFEAVGGFDERFFASEEIWLSKALRQRGRFVILRQAVMTSGRKMRAYTPRQIFAISLRLLWKGPAGWQQREGLELWYDAKRE
jgi:glycosyltransferase involved in cell wall biosynthesis